MSMRSSRDCVKATSVPVVRFLGGHPLPRAMGCNRNIAKHMPCMSEKENLERVWDIIEKVSVCMLTTQFGGGLRARPVEARPVADRAAHHGIVGRTGERGRYGVRVCQGEVDRC